VKRITHPRRFAGSTPMSGCVARLRPSPERQRATARRWGSGDVRQDFEFQSWLLRLGVRYLTDGSGVGYILNAGPAGVKQLRELKL
jgi:hypothetical protein